MRNFSFYCGSSLTSLVLAGCATSQQASIPLKTQPAAIVALAPTIVQAGYSPGAPIEEPQRLQAPQGEPEEPLLPPGPPGAEALVPTEADEIIGLPDLIALTVQRNPRLAEVSWAVEAARGRAVQAGLYPNPTTRVSGNELSDRTGPGGIWTVYAGQEIVTASKLELSQAAALKEVDQAALKLVAERYRVFTEVRRAFFEAVTLQRRAEILVDLVKLAEQSTANANKLLQAKEAAELDVVQLEVDLERYRADLEATRRSLPAAYQKLAARIGIEEMSISRLIGDLNTPLPPYDLDQVRLYMLSIHPELRSAQIGVERAHLVLERARVEPIPNVTVGTGYTYQGQNRSNDWDIGVSVPLPLWNKNQGNIAAAQALIHESTCQVARIQNDLVNQLATGFTQYAASRERVERYQAKIVPRAQRTFELSRTAYQGGQFEYLRVLEAQRAVAEANLELVRSLGEMWSSASGIAGLMLEDDWPLSAPVPTLAPEESVP